MTDACKDAEVTEKMVASQGCPWGGQGAKLRIYSHPLSPLVIFKDYPLVIFGNLKNVFNLIFFFVKRILFLRICFS